MKNENTYKNHKITTLKTLLILSIIPIMLIPSVFAQDPGQSDPSDLDQSESSLNEPFSVTDGLILDEPDPSLGVTFFGKGGFSADALGQNGGGGTIQAEIPAGSTVEHAYLYATTFSTDVTTLDIDFDGITYTFSEMTHSNYDGCCNLQSYKYTSADLVNQVSAKFVSTGPGIIDFVIGNDPSGLDGVTLVVIFSNPLLPEKSIALLDGGVSVSGEETIIGLSKPLDKSVSDFSAIMSLSIGFSYQGGTAGHVCGTGQVSEVDVNGVRLTSCAGHYDDGYAGNGGLVTTGGVGDDLLNPLNPDGSGGEDDELYNIESFLADGDTLITLNTRNPSSDDNIYALIIEITARASVGEICGDGIDNDGDGLIDEGCIITVDIDIKPGSDPSSWNCADTGDGIPVAVFSTVDFDASTIDLTSLRIEEIPVTEVHDIIHLEDENDDGFDDAVLHLDSSAVCEAASDIPLKETGFITLAGSTTDGEQFEGTGDIRIVKR